LEQSLNQFWKSLVARTKRTEEKVRKFQQERFAKGEGTLYESDSAKSYFHNLDHKVSL
jgi:hypothetical protein